MRTSYTLRRAVSADRPSIGSFQRAAVARAAVANGAAAARWHTPAQELDALVDAGRYFVADHDGHIVAGAGWEPHMRISDTAVMRSVFVDQAYGGLAAEMVRTVEDAAVTAGFDHILVPAAHQAAGLYRKLGYMSADSDDMVLEPGIRVGYCRMWKHAA
jgi:hypothetical protein